MIPGLASASDKPRHFVGFMTASRQTMKAHPLPSITSPYVSARQSHTTKNFKYINIIKYIDLSQNVTELAAGQSRYPGTSSYKTRPHIEARKVAIQGLRAQLA
ncbi:MAG: hypothetical protein JSS57_23800 [Proteobacteria bacterium]|nr:hypothetical protein [Pseudomonadota bacterium]